MKTGYTLHEKVHATDWLPSLVSMATGGQDFRKFAPAGEPPYLLGDGIDVWATLSTGAPSPRDWLLLETHPAAHTVHGDAIIVGDWKIYRRGPECVVGAGAALACFCREQARCFNAPPPFSTPPPPHTHTHTLSHPPTHTRAHRSFPGVENGWFPPPGQDPATTPYTLKCGAPQPPAQPDAAACAQTWCLWNVTADPCEYFDVAAEHPDVVASLVARLKDFSATAVPPEAGSGCSTKKVAVGDSFSFVPCDWQPPAA